MTDIPLSRVLAAIIPSPRTPDECTCPTCREERARDTARADWRKTVEEA